MTPRIMPPEYYYRLSHLEGMFIGSLTEEELHLFNRACIDGWAQCAYIGVSGFLGYPKVKIL